MYEWVIVNWRDKEEYLFWDGSKVSSSYSGWSNFGEAKIYSYTEMICFNLPDYGAWVPVESLEGIVNNIEEIERQETWGKAVTDIFLGMDQK